MKPLLQIRMYLLQCCWRICLMEGEPDPTDQTKTNIYKYLWRFLDRRILYVVVVLYMYFIILATNVCPISRMMTCVCMPLYTIRFRNTSVHTHTRLVTYLSFLRFPSIDKKIVRGKYTQKQIGGISTGITV
jgi:hypothetical protein